ncbi:hypothetical protein [Streptomyces sp. NPDC102282]|uniref:hypothetical protein n=1 Tax=Streptomyces sp. NPDC102282 TaxID=3366154 RepID=UPI003800A8DA
MPIGRRTGEPTSFHEKAKTWAKKHETAVRVVKAVGTTVGAVIAIMVVKHVMTQNVTEYADDDQATEDAEDDQATEEERRPLSDTQWPSTQGRSLTGASSLFSPTSAAAPRRTRARTPTKWRPEL